ncbi:MAG TPA: two-component regulator propeller domain-containing protein [Chitinophagaceae bacterium]
MIRLVQLFPSKLKLLLIFSLITTLQINAQEYSYAHYDVRDGLASSVVYDAANDKDGFMWFATETGLSRFDGTQFRNFTIQDGLPDNEIMKLYVDSKGRVWIMPFRNTICYYYKGKIHTPSNDPYLSSVRLASPAFAMQEDQLGNLLISETYNIHLLRPDGGYKIFTREELNVMHFLRAGLSRDGNVEVAAAHPGHGFVLYGIVNERVSPPVVLGDLLPNGPNSVILTPELKVIRKKQSLKVFAKDSVYDIPLPGHFISVSRLPGNYLSLNTIEGSYVYNLSNAKIVDTFAKNRSVTTVVPDHEGNWWFCTQGQGIYRLISSGFENFPFSNTKPLAVHSIVKFNSVLYMGADKYTLISGNRDNFSSISLPALSGTGRVTSVLKPDHEKTIIGTDFGLFVHKNGKEVAHIPSLTVKSLYLKNDKLIVGVHTGAFSFRLSEMNDHDTIWRQRSNVVWMINDVVYIGTLNGLFAIGKNGAMEMGKINPVFTRRITSMAESADGTLWIGTYGEGVIGLKDTTVVHVISQKNGLTSDNCRALFIQGDQLWVGTEKGINKVQIAKNMGVTQYTMADGLPSDIINTIHADKDTVYVGTSEGLTIFNEAGITQQSTCLLRLTGITADTTSWLHDTSNFLLPHNYKTLQFDFSGISFKSGSDITYYYRLSGLNNDWQKTRSSFLSYPSLPSGSYTLECYAVNKFGIKSNTLSIPFTVEKTVWETTWFRILAGVLLIAAVWMFIVFRLRVLRRREQSARQIEKRMTELEQMALKAQMNPHFIFNSLNSIQQYVLENDFIGINSFITGFASLVRQTLEVSSKQKISLDEELHYISTYLKLEKMRLEDKFSYEINVRDDITPTDYSIPPLILQPCLENSIRHGIRYRKDKNGKITVNILKDNMYLLCVIEDNGVGRKLAEQYKGARHIEYQSKGMALTASRIAMLPGNPNARPSVDWEDITTEDGTIAGTRVIIRLPLEDVL